MLQRFIELEQQIMSTGAIIKKDLPCINNEEWLFLGKVKILKPFNDAIESRSDEKNMTASLIIVMIRCM